MTLWKTVIFLVTTVRTSNIKQCFFVFVSIYQLNNLCLQDVTESADTFYILILLKVMTQVQT